MACSNETFEPSAKLVTIVGFWPHFSANPFCVVGLRYRSWRPLMFPMTRGVNPSPLTYRKRLISTPGWSPSHAERITPAFLAYVCRIGPMVASSSAFIRMTCLPCSKASSTIRAPNSTAPVTSTSASICGDRVRSVQSSVTAGLPCAIASSSSSWLVTICGSRPPYRYASMAFSM